MKSPAVAFAGALLLAGGAWGQSVPVYQMGTALPNDIAKVQRNGQIRNPGTIDGDNNGIGVNPFAATDYGQYGICSNSNKSTGPYNQICLGHDSSGNGLLSVNSLAGEPNHALKIYVNGALQPFPGDAASFILPIALTDNKTGPLTTGVAPLTVMSRPGLLERDVFNWSIMAGPSGNNLNYSSISALVQANAGSTVNVVSGIGSYVINNTVPIGQKSQTAGFYSSSVCAADNAQCWGIATIVSDNPSLSNQAVSTATGKFLYNEFDLNITSPDTRGGGLLIGGTALPVGVTLDINAISIDRLWGAGGDGTGTSIFSNGLIVTDACCATGVYIGLHPPAATFGPDTVSMPITMGYRTGANVPQTITLAAGFGMLVVGGSGTYGVQTADGGGANGLNLGRAVGTAGANRASQAVVLNYQDSANVARNYGVRADTVGALAFTGTGAAPSFTFNGDIAATGFINANGVYKAVGTPGVTCSGAPTGSFASTNGIVTHC